MVAILACLGMIGSRIISPSPEQIQDRKVAAALLACQKQIIAHSKFGDAEQPPFSQNHGSGNEFYFAWPTGSFHFKNGFGASVKMSASCIGDLSTGEIKALTLNGEDVL
jgi:hypothetical protein